MEVSYMDKKKYHRQVELIFKKHYREFCLLSYRYTSSMDVAEDIVQDVFVKVLTKEEIQKIQNAKSYIWTAVKNKSLNHLRRTKKERPLEEQDLSFAIIEDCSPLDTNIDKKIKLAMGQLPEQCKKVFELCAMEGEKYSVAAETMDISVNTVKTHIKKAYRILRSELRNTYISIVFFAYFQLFTLLF